MAFCLGQGLEEGMGVWAFSHDDGHLLMLVHNILPMKGLLAAFGEMADGACSHCGACTDMAHFFWPSHL
jgi:hypothetical protein